MYSENNVFIIPKMYFYQAIQHVLQVPSIAGAVVFSSSMSAIVPCHLGQEVWAAVEDTAIIYEFSSRHRNQFSGLMVKAGLD